MWAQGSRVTFSFKWFLWDVKSDRTNESIEWNTLRVPWFSISTLYLLFKTNAALSIAWLHKIFWSHANGWKLSNGSRRSWWNPLIVCWLLLLLLLRHWDICCKCCSCMICCRCSCIICTTTSLSIWIQIVANVFRGIYSGIDNVVQPWNAEKVVSRHGSFQVLWVQFRNVVREKGNLSFVNSVVGCRLWYSIVVVLFMRSTSSSAVIIFVLLQPYFNFELFPCYWFHLYRWSMWHDWLITTHAVGFYLPGTSSLRYARPVDHDRRHLFSVKRHWNRWMHFLPPTESWRKPNDHQTSRDH